MARQTAVVLYVMSMIGAVVGVDLLFFRSRFWERLMVNVDRAGVRGVLLKVSEAPMTG